MSLLDPTNRDKLTSYLINETNSYIELSCPVCSGRLKISKSPSAYGAYKCYTNYCEPNEIRQALGITDTKNYQLSPYKKQIQKSLYSGGLALERKIHSAKPLSFDLEDATICKLDNYQPLQSTERSFADGSKRRTTIYPYSNTQRVYRLDKTYPDTSKSIYLQYLAEDGSWQSGVGFNTWQLYSHGVFDQAWKSGNTILFVEGEKTAEHVKEHAGILTITAASHCYNYNYLYKIWFSLFAKWRHISNVLIVPDDDEPGRHKAEMVEHTCWYLKKRAKIVTLQELGFSFEPALTNTGLDLADFDLKQLQLL